MHLHRRNVNTFFSGVVKFTEAVESYEQFDKGKVGRSSSIHGNERLVFHPKSATLVLELVLLTESRMDKLFFGMVTDARSILSLEYLLQLARSLF